MREDRFLTGILVFIGVLVVVAVGVFFIRQNGEQAYGPEAAPEGVVRNYVIALQKGDYGRAYSYLEAGSSRPSEAQFRQSMGNLARDITVTGIQIGSSQAVSDQEANVAIDVVQYQGGLFSSPYRQGMTAVLVRQGEAWKIRSMPYPFWAYDLPAAPPVKAPAATP